MRGTWWFVVAVMVFDGALACSSDDSDSSDTGSRDAGGAENGSGGQGGSGATTAGTGGRESDGGTGNASGGTSNASGGSNGGGGVTTYGAPYEGGEFHLGPVDWEESQWHNACAPGGGYAPAVRQAEGDLLAGLWNGVPNVAGYCDACIHVTTAQGKSALLRVVTYGDTTPNSIDVSPAAFAILDSGEYPRSMSWQFAKCPDTGNVMYEFQTGSSQWWTSLWVRNARVPLTSVEVKSANHPNYVELSRGSDGTLTDGAGFGEGPFSIRLTGADGQQIEDDFDWPASGVAGVTLTGSGNFD